MSKPSSTGRARGRSGRAQRSVVVTPQAEADLEEIWLAIALDSPRVADGVLRRLASKIDGLSEFPAMGSPRPELSPAARMLVEGNYLVLYEAIGGRIEVVRVVHGARDLSDLP